MDGAHKRILEQALQIVKSRERLAVALDVPLEDLEGYIKGNKPLPNQAFISALDIVASNGQRPRK